MLHCHINTRPWLIVRLLPLALLLLGTVGCVTINCSPLARHVAADPGRCENVSVIFVEATPDLGNWGGVPELSGYFRNSGIETFYFDPDVHGDEYALAAWIRHEKVNRGRRVMVVGWSYGLVNALDAIKVLQRTNVCVDTLVGIDCFCLNCHRGHHLQPRNTGRVVLIYRESAQLPDGFHRPAICQVATCNHLGMPGHRVTVHTLFKEAIRLGQRGHCAASHPTMSEIMVPSVDEESAADIRMTPLVPSEPVPVEAPAPESLPQE